MTATHPSRFLITGLSGFVGEHLASYLRTQERMVFGFGKRSGPDISDQPAIEELIGRIQPDVIVHLAAAPKSAPPGFLASINVGGTLAVVRAVARIAPKCLIFVASSSAVYAARGQHPVDETAPLSPSTDYGRSKLAQENAAIETAEALGVQVVIARTFNLLGPGLPPDLAPGAFAAKIAALEMLSGEGQLETGPLDPVRDFTDVRDAVRAYLDIVEFGEEGAIYNVCSATPRSIRSCVEVLVRLASRPIRVRPEVSPVPSGIAWQVGDYRRLGELNGWRPTYGFEDSLEAMLNFERGKLAE
jgi:GDP-4-dehydro-6-deoxy-D-mannose reductase